MHKDAAPRVRPNASAASSQLYRGPGCTGSALSSSVLWPPALTWVMGRPSRQPSESFTGASTASGSAGLGAGIVSGQLQTWHPGVNETITNQCLRDAPAYEREGSCPDDGSVRLPGLLPILDLTMSTWVNFSERASARLDVGLHNLFYVGTAFGTVF